jgi:hypothetical protein
MDYSRNLSAQTSEVKAWKGQLSREKGEVENATARFYGVTDGVLSGGVYKRDGTETK